jgi:hypothetical protein
MIQFTAVKTELIHFTRNNRSLNSLVVVSGDYVIHPVQPPAVDEGKPPRHAAVRWLGVWLDRKLQ